MRLKSGQAMPVDLLCSASAKAKSPLTGRGTTSRTATNVSMCAVSAHKQTQIGNGPTKVAVAFVWPSNVLLQIFGPLDPRPAQHKPVDEGWRVVKRRKENRSKSSPSRSTNKEALGFGAGF